MDEKFDEEKIRRVTENADRLMESWERMKKEGRKPKPEDDRIPHLFWRAVPADGEEARLLREIMRRRQLAQKEKSED